MLSVIWITIEKENDNSYQLTRKTISIDQAVANNSAGQKPLTSLSVSALRSS
jgi:hypothetical protein